MWLAIYASSADPGKKHLRTLNKSQRTSVDGAREKKVGSGIVKRMRQIMLRFLKGTVLGITKVHVVV
jgi:hypothetical protein